MAISRSWSPSPTGGLVFQFWPTKWFNIASGERWQCVCDGLRCGIPKKERRLPIVPLGLSSLSSLVLQWWSHVAFLGFIEKSPIESNFRSLRSYCNMYSALLLKTFQGWDRVGKKVLQVLQATLCMVPFMAECKTCWWKTDISYCWWKKSCTSWWAVYPVIIRALYIPGGAGFLPSTVSYITLYRSQGLEAEFHPFFEAWGLETASFFLPPNILVKYEDREETNLSPNPPTMLPKCRRFMSSFLGHLLRLHAQKT